MENIQLSYPFWWLLPLSVLAILLSVWYYHGKGKYGTPLPKYLLVALRALTLFLAGFLLMRPIMMSKKVVEIPQETIVLVDKSSSVGAVLNTEEKKALNSSLELITQNETNTTLLSFDRGIIPWADSIEWDGDITNISASLEQTLQQFEPGSIGQIILVTDGIYNEGVNPNQSFLGNSIPLHTLALGDTSEYSDLRIERVLYSNIAYVDDIAQIEVDVLSQKSPATNKKISLEVLDDSRWRTVQEKRVSLAKDRLETIVMELPVKREGVVSARVRIDRLDQEKNLNNNRKDIYIEGLRSKQNIYLIARAPHPDIGALRRSLQNFKNYEVDFQLITDPDLKYRPDADLYVLFDLPISGVNSAVLDEIKSSNKPLMFFATPSADWLALESWQSLLKVDPKTNGSSSVSALLSNDFSSFTLTEETQTQLERYPPVTAPFADVRPQPDAKIMAYQKVGDIETTTPLLALGKSGGRRMGIMIGSEFFRWPIYEFTQNENTQSFDEIITQLMQYLTLREDKRRLRARLNKKIFGENERVLLSAELYNESYENITSENINVTITDQDGKQYLNAMSVIGEGYEARLGPFGPGNYSYVVKSPLSGVRDVSGKFTVQTSDLEGSQTKADHNLLRYLSSKTGGTFTSWPVSMEDYVQNINDQTASKPKLVEEKVVKRWIDTIWILLALLLLLSAEWIIRRLSSSY